MKQTILGAALISVLILVTASVSVEAASFNSFKARELTFDVDHFKCYRPEFYNLKPIFKPFVALEDQFMTEKVEVFTHLRLCNATGKRHGNVVTRIKNKEHHFVLYHFNRDLNAKPIQGGVTVLNQFGQQKLKIEDARILAVPTAKEKVDPNWSTAVPPLPLPDPDQDPNSDPPLPPDTLSHYKCYYATGTGPDPIPSVFLFDQFERVSHQVLSPVLFCNPVVKTREDEEPTKLHTEDHLTCYKLSIATEQPKYAKIYNQFIPDDDEGNHIDMVARAGDILCVPSKKVAFDIHTPAKLTAIGDDDGTACKLPEPGGGFAGCKTDDDCSRGEACRVEGPDCICVAGGREP